jgi:predicted transcriptional regulator
MDKIVSTRVDEAVARQIDALAGQLGKTKKAIIEDAIRHYGEKVEVDQETDVFETTGGAWKRDESPGETVRKIRKETRGSYQRSEP